MNVQQLIDLLLLVEDKTIPVHLSIVRNGDEDVMYGDTPRGGVVIGAGYDEATFTMVEQPVFILSDIDTEDYANEDYLASMNTDAVVDTSYDAEDGSVIFH